MITDGRQAKVPRAGKRIKGGVEERAQARDRLRNELITAARRLAIDKGGYDNVTMRLIADRVGYTAPIVYEYFSSKRVLLLELIDIGFTELALHIERAHRPAVGGHAPSTLLAVAQAYWDFALAEPTLYRLMHSLVDVPFGTAQTPAAARECFQLLKAVVEDAAPHHPATDYDSDAATDLVWAQLHGLVTLSLDGRIKGGLARGRDLIGYLAESVIQASTQRNAVSPAQQD